jgi:hypothetical protein
MSRTGYGDKRSRGMQRPVARSEGLIVEQLGDELLVYDLETNHGHSLGSEAARVWRRCDGRTPVEGLGAQLALDGETVGRALDELDACGLLDAPVAGSTRRELGVTMVKAGVAAATAPLIVSVVAPTPVQAATLAFCQRIGGVNNCGVACCQEGTDCCCCHNGAAPGQRSCVPFDATHQQCKDFWGHPGSFCSCNG